MKIKIRIINKFCLFRYRKACLIMEDGEVYSYLHIGLLFITIYSGFDYETYLEYIEEKKGFEVFY